MSQIQEFSYLTTEKLNHYVYALVDKDTNKIHYIGKGQNQRVFESLNEKNNQSNNILQAYILRHGLTENEALTLEASLINVLPYFSFSNLPFNSKDGEHNKDLGVDLAENIEAKYKADEIHEKDIKHKVLVVYVHNSVDAIETKLTEVGLYECSRKAWPVSEERVKKADFVIARYKGGLIKEIYKPKMWYKYPTDDGSNRYAFEGDVVIDNNIRELYINKVLKLTQESRGWPTRYINI